MGHQDKLIERILMVPSDANISFHEMCRLLRSLGFQERVRGSHHIFTRQDVAEILNVQPKGAKAKPYQVKQIRSVIVKYKLRGERND